MTTPEPLRILGSPGSPYSRKLRAAVDMVLRDTGCEALFAAD